MRRFPNLNAQIKLIERNDKIDTSFADDKMTIAHSNQAPNDKSYLDIRYLLQQKQQIEELNFSFKDGGQSIRSQKLLPL